MNAAIRSVVRTALYHDLKVTGIIQGYQGLLQKIPEMDLGSVANIIQRGGTILKAGRYLDFHQPTVRAQAAQILKMQRSMPSSALEEMAPLRGSFVLSRTSYASAWCLWNYRQRHLWHRIHRRIRYSDQYSYGGH